MDEKEFKIAIDGINNLITVDALSGSGSTEYSYTAYFTSPDGYTNSFSFNVKVGGTSTCNSVILTPPSPYDTYKTYTVGGAHG